MPHQTPILAMIFLLALSFPSVQSSAATITWDGGGDGKSWHDARNWGGDALPSASDIVEIRKDRAEVEIKASVEIAGLVVTRSTLNVRGNGVRFAATGLATVNGNVVISGGATVFLPAMTQHNALDSAEAESVWRVEGVGSLLDLPNLATVVGPRFFSAFAGSALFIIEALNGGKVNLGKVSRISRPRGSGRAGIQVIADGPGSVIDLSTLTSFVDEGEFPNSRLEARRGGTIQIPAVSVIRNVDVINVTRTAPSNTPPASAVISDRQSAEATQLQFTVTASDPDTPAQKLTFSLDPGAPAGASIDPNSGLFAWTPTEAQGPSTNTITVRVTDNGSPPMSSTATFTVIVNEVNAPPVLADVVARSVAVGERLELTLKASDPDIPVQTLAFHLVSRPAGTSLNSATGVLTWTPLLSDASRTHRFSVRVEDSGQPPLSATKEFAVTVNPGGIPTDQPRLEIRRGPSLSLALFGQVRASYVLESAPDLADPKLWTELSTITMSDTVRVIDLGAPQERWRFFRARQRVPPPPNDSIPVIQTPPKDQTAASGANVTFTVEATGAASLTYQWSFADTPILAATGPTLTLNAVQPTHAGSYSVVVRNSFGSATASAILTILTTPNTPPMISSIPDQTIAVGAAVASVSFTISDAETPAVSLIVTPTSSNQSLIPDQNILLGGSGETRLAVVVPVANQTGTATITLTVTDSASLSTQTKFILKVIGTLPTDPPTKQWDRTFGGNNSETLRSIQQTADGGYIVGGESYSPASGNKSSENFGGADFWVLRLDTNGNKLWERTFGGTGPDHLNEVRQTADGGFIVAGSPQSPVSGNKTAANFGVSNWDYWLIRLDGNGNKVWEKVYGGTGQDELWSVRQTPDGGFICAGHSESTQSGNKTSPNFGGHDLWIVRLNANGDKLWEKPFGGSGNDASLSLSLSSDGGFILGGESYSSESGTKTSPNFGSADFWVVRIDANGNQLWGKSFGGSQHDVVRAVYQTLDGGYIVGGSSKSPADGNKTSLNRGTAGSGPDAEDYWIVRLDANGAKLWDQSFGGARADVVLDGLDRLQALQPTSDGGFLLGGWTRSGVSGNKSSPHLGGESDFWLVRLDASGNKLWDKAFGGSANEEMHAVHITLDGGFVAGGFSSSTNGDKTSPNFGLGDFWLIKLKPGP